jgi:hypothetical protein
MRWSATYDAVTREKGDTFDLVAWVTLENASGKDFHDASLKLMAGDVARAGPQNGNQEIRVYATPAPGATVPPVTEKPFDDFHLYTVARPTTVLDREIKQVEFVRAASIPAKRFYVYDGVGISSGYANTQEIYFRNQAAYGAVSNPKVWIMMEFRNSDANHLGMPLPAGAVKVYRADTDGHNEFVGEDRIGHTAKDEIVRLHMGSAFDIVGERRQTKFSTTNTPTGEQVEESFEIKVRNHKSEAVDVRVVEHLYRGANWEIRDKSADFTQLDSRTIEFHPHIEPNGEAVIRYTAHYTW